MKQSSSMESFLNEDDMVVKHVHQNLKSSKHESSQLQSSVRCDAVDVRTRDKKDLLEQWLQICQRSKQKHFQIESLNIDKNQLVQEQLELASEREKCVIVDGHTTGVFDASKPQYMDERLLIIDNDIMVIEERIYDLTLSSTHVSNDGSYIQDFDHGWQEVLKIVEGLELDEFRLLTRTMISELVDLRALMYDSQIQMSEKETMMYELRASFDLIRNAAIEASMDYERKNKQAMIHSNKIIDFIVNCYEHESFPKTLVDFLSETNLEDINRHSTGSNVLAEHYQCDNECTQEYRTLSIDLNKKIETPKMTRIQKNAIQLPTNQQTPMQDDSKRILRSERLVNLHLRLLAICTKQRNGRDKFTIKS